MCRAFFAAVLAAAVVSQAPAPAPAELPLNQIKLPPGFSIGIYAAGVANARSLARGAKGAVAFRGGALYVAEGAASPA